MLRLFIVFLSLSPFPSLANPDNPYLASSNPSNYTCQINKECLNYLDNTLLNKTSDRGIYKYCSDKYENIKLCCVNPLDCQESYGRNRSNELKNNSLDEVEESGTDVLSCHLNQLSSLISSLSGVQSEFCNMGINVCKESCEVKLQEVKDSFRECFSIADSYNISAILEKARSSTKDQDCYKEMIDIADKYKRQSLNKLSLLREDLKSQDIIDCEGIKEVKTTKSLNNLAQNVCHQAKAQKEEKIQQEEAQAEQERQQAELERQQRELEEAQRLKAEADLLGSGDINEWKERQRKMREEIDAELGLVNQRDESLSANSNQSSNNNSNNNNNKGSQGGLNKANLLGAGALGAGAGALGTGLSDDRFFKRKIYPTDKESLTNSTLDFPTEEEKPKGIFRRAWGKGKSIAKSSLIAILNKIPFIKSIKEQRDEELINKMKESISLSQMVYQSVEAPQIEPLKEQEFQNDPDNPVFTSYDLVRRKSAGVLVKIKNVLDFNADITRDFKLDMKVGGKVKVTRCLDGDNLEKTINKRYPPFSGLDELWSVGCIFRMFLEKNGIASLFIELPIHNFEYIFEKNIPIQIDLIDMQSEEMISSIDFKVNVIETKSISIGLVPITNVKCKVEGKEVDLSTDFSIIRNVLKSRYLKSYLPSIFPVAEPEKLEDMIDFIRIEDLKKHLLSSKEIQQYSGFTEKAILGVQGNCDKGNLFSHTYSEGTDAIFLHLQDLIRKTNKNRAIIIASKEYMDYHGITKKASGFVHEVPRNLWVGFLRLFYDVDFKIGLVGEGIDLEGTLFHELGHTMNQLKEFYKKDSKCKRFNSNKKLDDCNTYQVGKGIKGQKGGDFKWIINHYAIMNSGQLPDYTPILIHDKWISRETYQKAFAFLKEPVDYDFYEEFLKPVLGK